jgi:cation:H+ antiporter
VVGGKRILRRDLLFGLIPAVILLVTANDGRIDRWIALLLLMVFAAFMVTCLIQARERSEPRTVISGHPLRHLTLAAIGTAVLVAGSELMVHSGIELAKRFGVSEAVIGLTLVAFGTSLPELATSVAAAVKRQSEISVGNVLGSNVFNLGLVVGTAFTIRPSQVPGFVITQDLLLLVAASIVVGVVVLRDARISRIEGSGMLLLFGAYLVFVLVRGS